MTLPTARLPRRTAGAALRLRPSGRPVGWGTWLRLGAVLLVTLLWLGAAAAAQAHAVVVGTGPPAPCALPPGTTISDAADCASGPVLAVPPDVVEVRFSEPVTPFAGGIEVVGPAGRRVEGGAPQVDGAALSVPVDATTPGTYRVRWRITADDTHPARGSFVFSVGQPSAPLDAADVEGDIGLGLLLQSLGRWLHFLGYALGFGTVAFRRLVLVNGRTPAEARPWRPDRLVGWGIVLLLLAEPLALLGQTASLDPAAPFSSEVVSGALDSAFGRTLGLRLGAALALWTLLGVTGEDAATAERAILVLGALLALLDGRAAHAASGSLGGLVLPLSAVHLMAAGVWVGGLAAWLTLRPTVDDTAARWSITHRFGRLALVALGVQVASGLALTALRLNAPLEMVTTAYGLALALKLGLLLAALAAAALAWRAAHTRAVRWRRGEAALLAGVLALAGLLVSLPPPRP